MASEVILTSPCESGFTIVIPALNEEAAIAATIERCLAARPALLSVGLGRVHIVVVSDGSTDRTVEIARGYPEIALIELRRNRGYGAAIQVGWQVRPAELLGFIDADGTCDPQYFVPMCASILRDGADVVLGSRMSAGNKMPLVRRLGNLCYAFLLRRLSRKTVQDTASGMRVVRRAVLPRLLPLPTGLHFTPAMSARALLEGVKVVEIPMPYQQRVGRSKLRIVSDGVRFLGAILTTTLYVRPSRLLLPVTGALAMCAALLMVLPASEFARGVVLEDFLIYRFLLASLLLLVSVTLLGAALMLEQLIAVSRGAYDEESRLGQAWWSRVDDRALVAAFVSLASLGAILAWPAAESYWRTRTVATHWSRIVLAMLSQMLAAQIAVTLLLNRAVVGVVRQQREWLRNEGRG